MRSVHDALRILIFRRNALETSGNKSLIKKILFVIVTLLPMAIYMVIYMPVFFWVESLEPAGGFHIIHTAIDDMIPVVEAFIIPYILWLPYLCAGMIAIAVKSRRISRKTDVLPSLHVYDAIVVAAGLHLTFPSKKGLLAASDLLTLLIILSTVFIKQHSVIDVISAIILFIPVFIIICFVIKPLKRDELKAS